MPRRAFVTLMISLIPLWARAEYRAFQLLITDTQSSQTRQAISTLDDIQYRSYYPLKKEETIVIQDSWMCWGRHGEGEHYCPNPRSQDATQLGGANGGANSTGKNIPAPTASSPDTRQPASTPR